MKKIFCCLITNSFLFLALNVSAQISGVSMADIKSIPDIDVFDLNGNHTSLKELAKNKVLFIDNWFIPCPPCFIEMKMLDKLYAKYAGNKDLCFITISRTDSSVVRKFIAKDSSMRKYVNTFQFFSGLDSFRLPVYFISGCNAKVEVAGKQLHALNPDIPSQCPDYIFRFSGYPTVLIFDKQSKLIFKKTGYDGNENTNMAGIEKIINPALASNK